MGRSRFTIASITNFPNPGQAKIDSVTVAKAIKVPNSIANTVTIGIRIFGKRWYLTILWLGRPLARANFIKSNDITSTNECI